MGLRRYERTLLQTQGNVVPGAGVQCRLSEMVCNWIRDSSEESQEGVVLEMT